MYKVSLTTRLCIFGACFILGLIAVGMVNVFITGVISDSRTQFLIISTLQNILVFCFPSILIAYFNGKNIGGTLSLDKCPQWKAILGVVVAFAFGFAFFNQIIYWNDSLKLPESWSEMEASLRKMEDSARSVTQAILSTSSIGGLIINVLVVGVITGFSEELFFRAGLQRMLGEAMPRQAAIWVATIVFSTLHFQFFGFVPRMLLGAFFGYLYMWTESIWVAIIAHALNNSIVVMCEWLIGKGVLNNSFDSLGVTEHGFPAYAMISLCLFCIFIYYRKFWFNKSPLHKIR